MAITRASASLAVVATSSPATLALPLLIGIRRLTSDSSVLLPAPLGPMMAVNCRSGICTVTPCSTVVLPWRLTMSRVSIIAFPCASAAQ
jgi:hypothetical protein